jgi:hypothetical protein
MSTGRLCLLLTVGLVAGCTTSNQLPTNSFAEPAALDRAMMRYYEAHAMEQWGYCLTPYIDGLTQVAVVEDRPDRLVLDVRYLYRDRQKANSQNSFATECVSYAGRQFTFGKGNTGGVEVVDMTGLRRS